MIGTTAADQVRLVATQKASNLLGKQPFLSYFCWKFYNSKMSKIFSTKSDPNCPLAMNEASPRAIKLFSKITSTQLLLNELIIEEVIGLFTVRDVHDGLTLFTIPFFIAL